MPREKEGYRANYAMLNDRFPDKDMLNIKDVMTFTGLSRNTVKKRFCFVGSPGIVSKADFARQISV